VRGRYNNNNIYITGSNAVKLDERHYTNKSQERTLKNNRNIRSKKAIKKESNIFYTLIFTMVIMTTFAVAILLLKTQFTVAEHSSEIIELKRQLMDIKKVNNQIESDISKSINMEEVYRIATTELGMVYPTKDNIKLINEKDATYTIQYADARVVEDEIDLSIGNILGFISEGW